MKHPYIWLMGAAGVALYLINKTGSVKSAAKAVKTGTQEILSSTGQRFETGWRYFSDGTTIDPFGNYWKGGQKIWSVPVVKKPTASSEAIFTSPTYDI